MQLKLVINQDVWVVILKVKTANIYQEVVVYKQNTKKKNGQKVASSLSSRKTTSESQRVKEA